MAYYNIFFLAAVTSDEVSPDQNGLLQFTVFLATPLRLNFGFRLRLLVTQSVHARANFNHHP